MADTSIAGLARSYQPKTPGDWSPKPTTIAEGLDELAGRPSGGGGWSAAAAANVDEGNGGATIDGSGDAVCSSDPFTLTDAGNVVDFLGTMQCTLDGGTSQTDFQLYRDGTPLGASIPGGTCSGSTVTLTLRIFDLPGSVGPHVYSMKASHVDGGPIASGVWQFTLAERQIVAVP